MEGNKTELLHKNFMEKIRKKIEILKNLNLEGKLNFQLSSYINSQNKKQSCFELNCKEKITGEIEKLKSHHIKKIKYLKIG